MYIQGLIEQEEWCGYHDSRSHIHPLSVLQRNQRIWRTQPAGRGDSSGAIQKVCLDRGPHQTGGRVSLYRRLLGAQAVDEKYVTERAYNNPKFVEDIVRDIAVKLNEDPNITWFAVETENFESIHNHNAYAYIEKRKI